MENNLENIMVDTQIKSRGIKDERVLEAMRFVKRSLFVPPGLKGEAYDDCPLPIGYGQTISQPYIVALMSEICSLKGDERVLEIGTGSGYQAAILSRLAKEVYTIERIEELAFKASTTLRMNGYDNINYKVGNGYIGWKEFAPFDVIMLTAAPEKIPDSLIDQLADGGVLVAPEGNIIQQLVVLKKIDGKILRRNDILVRFVKMIN